MVESPKQQALRLDLQKSTTFVAKAFKLTQGDKGYLQPFRLTDAWNKYGVEPENLGFSATKSDGTIISVEDEPERFTFENDTWYFKLPEEIAEAVGNVSAYFFIKDEEHNILASTTKFSYEVGAKFGDDIPSNNYVSAFKILAGQFQEYIENAKNLVNGYQNFTNEAKAELTKHLDKLKQQTDTWLKEQTDKVDELTKKFNADYNEAVTRANNQTEQIGKDWDAQTKKIDQDYQKQLKDLLASINSDWNKQKGQLTTDIETLKTDLISRLNGVTSNIDTLQNTIVPKLQKELEDMQKSVSSIDISKYATIASVYTREVMDKKLEQAGKVKTASINGGSQVEPDDKGNLNLKVPDPDLTKYALSTDLTSTADELKEDIDKKIKTIKQDYTNMVNGHVDGTNNQIKELDTKLSELSSTIESKPDVHICATADEALTYSNANRTSIVINKGGA